MKPITAPAAKHLPANCDGPVELFWEQQWEVEEEDVGTVKENYLGYKHTGFKFGRGDVGKRIIIRSQKPAYECWFFAAESKGE